MTKSQAKVHMGQAVVQAAAESKQGQTKEAACLP